MARHDALRWMLSRGLVLRSDRVDGWLSPGVIDPRVGRPLFHTHRLDGGAVDFVLS